MSFLVGLVIGVIGAIPLKIAAVATYAAVRSLITKKEG